jgi:hypothetical protein
MIHATDGKLRCFPKDLVSYLEGDFAAWCDRMQAERGRNGGTASSRELSWATPDEDAEAALAAEKGREHEARVPVTPPSGRRAPQRPRPPRGGRAVRGVVKLAVG